MENKHKNSLTNLSLLFLSFWILFSAWQLTHLTKENKALVQKIKNYPTKNDQQDILVNQAILNAFSEYTIRHDIQATNYWLKIALHNTHMHTNSKCISILKDLIQTTNNKQSFTINNESIKTRLSSIIDILKNNENIENTKNSIIKQHNLTSIFKVPSINNTYDIFNQLYAILDNANKNFNENSSLAQLDFEISKAMNIIIQTKTMHPEMREKAVSIYTQLKTIKKQLHKPQLTISALSYCNTQNSIVTIANFSEKKYKQESKINKDF